MIRLAAKVAGALLLLAAEATNLGGCGVGAASSGGGSSSGSGGSNSGCLTTTCLPLAQPVPSTWIAEIDPPSNATAAITFDGADLGKPNAVFRTNPQATATVTFTAPSNAPVPARATAILAVPSPIGGRPPVTFQATTSISATNVLTASLAVPEALIGSPATVTLVPLPPADQQNPPYTFSTPLGMTMQVAIATDNFTINGSLQTAAGQVPGTTYVAQAFQGGALVSSGPPVQQSDGSFQLLIPSAVLGLGVPLTVQLTPQSTTDPWFVSNPIAASDPLPAPFPMPIVLSASTGGNTPTYFNAVVSASSGGPVIGAVVQAQTSLGQNMYGSTQFSRTGTTGDGTGGTTIGVAALSLIPGTMATPLAYSFNIVPPANSPFATTCFSSVGVYGGGASASSASSSIPAFTVGSRGLYTGVVSIAGSPLANVSVTATPGPDPVPGCASTPAAPASATTGTDGSFRLALDPGTYQIDYDPPAGSAAARRTDYGIVVGGSSQVPAPVSENLEAVGRVEGTVLAPDGTVLPSATVRIYEPRCADYACNTNPPPPRLRAQAVTDANGFFRVAVQPNN